MSCRFVKAQFPTPLLNDGDLKNIFGICSSQLPIDAQGLFRPLEMVVFPEVVMELISEGESSYEVFYPEYCGKRSYFVPKIGVQLCEQGEKEKSSPVISVHKMEKAMVSLLGRPYLWGGNYPEPLTHLAQAYPALQEVGNFDGVDCSGLIYWACGGKTPRNVSGLQGVGQEIALKNWDPKVGDFIVCEDHVVVVISGSRVIESREKDGVIISDLESRLRSLIASKEMVVVRRESFVESFFED